MPDPIGAVLFVGSIMAPLVLVEYVRLTLRRRRMVRFYY